MTYGDLSIFGSETPYHFQATSSDHQMWRIKYGRDGYYTISPYYNHQQYLSYDGATLITGPCSAPSTDNNILWEVEKLDGNFYYKISPKDYPGKYLTYPSGNIDGQLMSIQSNDSNAEQIVILSTVSNLSSGLIWQRTTDVHPSGTTNSGYSHIGATPWQFNAVYYSSEPEPLQSFSWSTLSGGDSILNVSSSGTGNSSAAVGFSGAGIDTVRLTYVPANIVYSYTIDVAPLADGVYFLKNKGTFYYADIESITLNNGTDVVQYDFTAGDSQRWRLEYINNQYYYILSVKSTTDYYLAVQNDYIADYAQVEVRSGSITDGMKWKITETASSAYRIIAKSAEAYSKGMTVDDRIISNNGTPIVQKNYINDTDYKDEWEIEPTTAYLPFHVPSVDFLIRCIGTLANLSYWNPLIQSSANSWNNLAETYISIVNTASSYQCEVDSYDENWYGLTSFLNVDETIVYGALIQINVFTLPNNVLVRQSTITHEIGHLLGLDDNPTTSWNSSLMNHKRNRESVYDPQTFDIQNVKYLYKIN